MKSAVFGAIGLGFLLLILSGLWSTLFPAASSWTQEKADHWIKVKQRLYELSPLIHGRYRPHGGPDPATIKAEYDSLQKENEQLSADYESTASRPNTIASVMKWSGMALAIVGIVGWYAVKNSS
jgi:hypothetical protein